MQILVGDILKSEAQTIVNTVNCVGVMGKGIALEFKKHFPDMYLDYVRKCERKEVKPGIPYVYKTLIPPRIVNFPTKDHWKSVSRIEDVERGMEYLLSHYKHWGITSLAIPPLGCGNGQLEWKYVGGIIYKYASQMEIPVELYAPYGTSPKELTESFLRSASVAGSAVAVGSQPAKLNPAWVALVEVLHRIENEPYHRPVGRTIFQKIAYVATREGLSTDFQYKKGSFGPFSSQLKSAVTELVNSNLLQEERSGQMFKMKVGPNYARIRNSFEEYFSQPERAHLIEKTIDLFMRVNTDQAELLATVLYSADSLGRELDRTPTEMEVLSYVMQWKQKRRPPLEETAVASTIRNLAMLGWLSVQPDAALPVVEEEMVFA